MVVQVALENIAYLAAVVSVSEEVRSRCHLKHTHARKLSKSSSSDIFPVDLHLNFNVIPSQQLPQHTIVLQHSTAQQSTTSTTTTTIANTLRQAAPPPANNTGQSNTNTSSSLSATGSFSSGIGSLVSCVVSCDW